MLDSFSGPDEPDDGKKVTEWKPGDRAWSDVGPVTIVAVESERAIWAKTATNYYTFMASDLAPLHALSNEWEGA